MTTRLRTWIGRPDVGDNYYCPRCQCRKNGYTFEVNGTDESCTNSLCNCHNEEQEVA